MHIRTQNYKAYNIASANLRLGTPKIWKNSNFRFLRSVLKYLVCQKVLRKIAVQIVVLLRLSFWQTDYSNTNLKKLEI